MKQYRYGWMEYLIIAACVVVFLAIMGVVVR